MFCQNCGTMNNDGNVTCTNCGAALRVPQQPAQQPQPQQYAQPQAQQPQYAPPQPQVRQPQYAPPQPQAQQSPYGAPKAPKAPNPYGPQPAPQGRPAPMGQPGSRPAYNIAPPQRTFDFYPFWFKFMVYAGFFITSLALFFLGLGQLIGWQYGSESYGSTTYRYVDTIKDNFGGLRAADIITGIIFLLLAVASIYVWYQFRYLRAVAPLYTLILYGSIAGLYLIYFLIDIIVLSTSDLVKNSNVKSTKIFPIVFPIILIVILGAAFAAQFFYFKREKARFIYYPAPKPAPAYPQPDQYAGYPQQDQYAGYQQPDPYAGYQQNAPDAGYQQNNQNNTYQ